MERSYFTHVTKNTVPEIGHANKGDRGAVLEIVGKEPGAWVKVFEVSKLSELMAWQNPIRYIQKQ